MLVSRYRPSLFDIPPQQVPKNIPHILTSVKHAYLSNNNLVDLFIKGEIMSDGEVVIMAELRILLLFLLLSNHVMSDYVIIIPHMTLWCIQHCTSYHMMS